MSTATTTSNGQNRHRPASFIQEEVQRLNERTTDPASAVQGMPPNFGRFPLDHIYTFSAIFGTFAKVYRVSDEALKHSEENARFMRNDPGIMECIEARQRATALLDWHLEPEDEGSQEQQNLCTTLTDIIQRIPRFTEYRNNLMHGIWYGRYGIQHRYRWQWIKGRRYRMPAKRGDDPAWQPINGDKLVFRYDDGQPGTVPGQVGIRVGTKYNAGDVVNNRWKVETTHRGLAYFLDDWERRLIAIHKHMIEDGAWEAGIDAGMVHGVGIRSRIYWDWFQKQEALAFLMEYLERSAGGIEVWTYPAGDAKALEKAKTAAKERVANGKNIVFFPKPMGDQFGQYDIQMIEPGMAGIESLKDILTNYFGHRIKRYILGQVLSSEAEATGMGSGLAELHLDTLLQIVKYDATNLEETITDELVEPLKRWNFPHAKNIHVRFVIDTESPDVEKKMEGFARAYEMGARLSEREVLEAIGTSAPEEDDVVLQQPQQGGGPGGMGPGGGMSGPGGDGDPGGPGGDGPTTFGPISGLKPAGPAQMADQLMQEIFGDPEKLDGKKRVYVAEGGKWVPRNVPEFDTGERSREGYSRERSATDTRQAVEDAAAATDASPSDAQRESGNYRKGKVKLHGLTISIETPRGAIRSGTNRAGESWQIEMPCHYGYVNRTEGRDGDHVDVFIGPEPDLPLVFVIDQSNSSGRFDEHKAMIGFRSQKAAESAYLASYNDDASARIRSITPMTMGQFRAWLAGGDMRRPLSGQVSKYASQWQEDDHPRDGSGQFTATAKGKAIGKGSTGDVFLQDGKAVKSALHRGSVTNEGAAYEKLKGVDGVAEGMQKGLEIHVEPFRNVVSVDAVDRDKRKGVGRFVRKHIPDVMRTVSEVSRRGISYNDVLQFGFNSSGAGLKLFDFSASSFTSPDDAAQSNLTDLSIFLSEFGLDDDSQTVSLANELLRNTTDYDDDNLLDDRDAENARRIHESVGQARNIYVTTNARTIGIDGAMQIPHDGKRSFVVSRRPLNDSETVKWELVPVLELGESEAYRNRKAGGQ